MKQQTIESVLSNSTKITHCQQCNPPVFFKKRSHLYRHQRQLHQQESQIFQCDHENCHKTFKRSSHLKRHMITHTKEKPFKCSACIMKFGYKHHLDRHFKIIHMNQLPKCHICSVQFPKKKSLAKHMRQKHQQILSKTDLKDSSHIAEEKIYYYEDEQYSDKQQMAQILQYYKPGKIQQCYFQQNDIQSKNNDVQPFVDKTIQKNFHYQLINPKDNSIAILQAEIPQIIEVKQLFRCQQDGCTAAFKQNYNLKRHISRIHKQQSK